MSAAVTLKVVQGPQSGAEFTYRLPTLCAVGRSQDCTLRLPNDEPPEHYRDLRTDNPIGVGRMAGTSATRGHLLSASVATTRPGSGAIPDSSQLAQAPSSTLRHLSPD
jgi:hypothetical protein